MLKIFQERKSISVLMSFFVEIAFLIIILPLGNLKQKNLKETHLNTLNIQ